MVTIAKGGPWCPYHGQPMKAKEGDIFACPAGCDWRLNSLTGSFVLQDSMEKAEDC